jgi:hypothetical protein
MKSLHFDGSIVVSDGFLACVIERVLNKCSRLNTGHENIEKCDDGSKEGCESV